MSKDARNLALCALIPLAAILVAWPFAEGGIIDDFSYIHMAKTLAETGRFAYNGWPTAMLGIQVWWGAAWIRLFGFSFTLVRMSVLPLALGAVVLAYLLARRAKLPPAESLFAALLTGLNPRVIVLAPTFMTDVPSLFFLLASLYGFVRAVESAEKIPRARMNVVAWLVVGMLCGVLGGTIRQTVWFAPLAGAAVLFVWPGVGLRSRLAALLCGAAGAACVVLGVRWFNSQPFAVPTRSLSHMASSLADVGFMARQVSWVIVGGIGAVAPVFVYRLSEMRHWRREQFPWLGSSPIVDGVIVTAVALVFFPATFVGAVEAVTTSPEAKPAVEHAVRLFRGLRIGMMLLLAVAVMAMVLQWRGAIISAARRMPAAVLISLLYLVPYSAAVTHASQTTGALFDRYYLPYVPLLACAFLYGICGTSVSQSGSRSAVWGWVLLAIIAAPHVAKLHDMFASCRARLAALAYLQSVGVARDRIMAGWDIDGWEQIERTGHMNDRRIRVPPGAYKAFEPDGYPEHIMLRDRLTALTPEYIVTDDPAAFPGDGMAFPRFAWTAWRPPFRRDTVICHQTSAASDTRGP